MWKERMKISTKANFKLYNKLTMGKIIVRKMMVKKIMISTTVIDGVLQNGYGRWGAARRDCQGTPGSLAHGQSPYTSIDAIELGCCCIWN